MTEFSLDDRVLVDRVRGFLSDVGVSTASELSVTRGPMVAFVSVSIGGIIWEFEFSAAGSSLSFYNRTYPDMHISAYDLEDVVSPPTPAVLRARTVARFEGTDTQYRGVLDEVRGIVERNARALPQLLGGEQLRIEYDKMYERRVQDARLYAALRDGHASDGGSTE